MSEAAALTIAAPSQIEEQEQVIHLVARNPQEMATAQGNLAIWFEKKIVAVASEVRELGDAVSEAKAHKWKSSTLEGQHVRALQRKLFYEKCLAAVRSGYAIIPDIPIDVFAIRTLRTRPRPNECRNEGEYAYPPDMPDETPQILPAGEGDYQNPMPLEHRTDTSYVKDGKTINVRTVRAVAFDSLEFPIIAAVPTVMQATEEAMVRKIFDQIGVSPQGHMRNADPLIIGQILRPRGGYSGHKTASFLIAWHLDLRVL